MPNEPEQTTPQNQPIQPTPPVSPSSDNPVEEESAAAAKRLVIEPISGGDDTSVHDAIAGELASSESKDATTSSEAAAFTPFAPVAPETPAVPTDLVQSAEGASAAESASAATYASSPVAPQQSTPETAEASASGSVAIGSGPVAPGEPSAVTPKKKFNLFPFALKGGALVATIVAGVLIFLGGGTVLAYNYVYQNPDKVVGDAIVNALTAKTISATGSAEIKSEEYTVKLNVSGRDNMNADMTLAVDMEVVSEEFTLNAEGEGIFSAEGDLYFKVQNLKETIDSLAGGEDMTSFYEVFGDIVAKYDSKWVKIGKEDLGDYSDEYAETQKCVADINTALESDDAFRKTVETEVMDLYKEHTFIVIGEKLGSEVKNDKSSLGYALTTDMAKVDAFVEGLADTEIGKRAIACDDSIDFKDFITEDDLEDADKEGEAGATVEAEIWVSRFGHELTELNVKVSDDEADGTFVINPTFNHETSIDIPTDTLTFADLQADIEAAYTAYIDAIYAQYAAEYSAAYGTY